VKGRSEQLGDPAGLCVGSLSLLKNHATCNEVHRGEHEPILTRDLFEAVQAKRVSNAVARHVRLRGSAALLAGCLFDDRGNRMSPTHANKRGVRYRYYVSHAILQNRKAEAGSIARVPAPEIETLVCDSARGRRCLKPGGAPSAATTSSIATVDRDPDTVAADLAKVPRHCLRRSS
jgi:site-specific DNA recombinase